jgi:hypothetical protein
MPTISQLLRFTLPYSSARASAFQVLRQKTASKGLVKTQYYGYVLPNEGFPAPKREDEMCWFLQWPQDSSFRDSKEFETDLDDVAEGRVRSLLFDMSNTKEGELEKGLEAPFCQFVSPISLNFSLQAHIYLYKYLTNLSTGNNQFTPKFPTFYAKFRK